jgi:RraA family protein
VNIGLRVLQRRRCVDDRLVELFRTIPVANVSDSMNRLAAGGSRLRPMHAGGQLSGPALTVRTRPGDNLMVHMALDLAVEGDVIVVDAGGDLTNAIIGELMLAIAIQKKLGGLVINGAIRDSAAIRVGSLPVYAAGITHRGPYKDGPGEVNVPIAIDGMTVFPGDLIVGDDDGVLAVPMDSAGDIYAAAHAKHQLELQSAIENAAGTSDRTWTRAKLISMGADFEA